MTEDEMKALIEKLTAQNEKLAKADEAQSAKNQELLGEVKSERQKRREAEQLAETAAEEARAKAEEVAAKSGDIETLKRQWEAQKAKEIEKLAKERDEANGLNHKLLVHGGINGALDKAKMAPEFKEMLRDHFMSQHQVEIRDGKAIVGGDELEPVVAKWAEEKFPGLKAAGQANGSGAPGGGKQLGKSLAEMGDAERLALAREGKLKTTAGLHQG